MKFTLFEVDRKRPLLSSATLVGYLAYFVMIVGLLSGCSTRVATENATGVSPQVLPAGTGQVPLPPNLFGGNYSPPVSQTNQYYPPSSAPINYPPATSLTCYLQRSGGYYYVGYGVRWDFSSDNGEQLEVINIDSGEYWSSPPQYPLPASFAITFYTAGQRQLAFTVRSRTSGQYCNGGQPIYDQVYVNQAQYY